VGCQWIRPEGRAHRVVPHTRKRTASTKSRRLSEERPSRSSARSEEPRRWFELRHSFLPRLPAYMKKGCSPHALDHPKVTRRMRTARASRLQDAASNPRDEPPKEFLARPNRTPPGGGRLPARGSGNSQQAGAPVSGQTVIYFTGRPGFRSEDRLPLPDPKVGEPTPKRRGCGWCRTSHPQVVIRHEHRSARAEMDRGPSRAIPTGVGTTSSPRAPKRSRRSDRHYPIGR
jgi:hypothetical protein